MATENTSEIAFFDVETTIPRHSGDSYAVLEFGAIVVCSKTLVELARYSTLIRPDKDGSISTISISSNGITEDMVAAAPTFRDVASRVFFTLHGRIWAGHNITRFDCVRIREAFAEIGRPAPEAKGIIDTLPLLTERFGRRAGNMKMATLGNYFGLEQQKHRSLDDVRMNLEVVKYCATVLFLESSLPDVFPTSSPFCKTTTQGKQANGNASPNIDSSLLTNMEEMNISHSRRGHTRNMTRTVSSPETCNSSPVSKGNNGSSGFLEPGEVLVDKVSVYQFIDRHNGKMKLLQHKGAPLKLCCKGLRILLGAKQPKLKLADDAGWPKMSIVVNSPPRLCKILDACDHVVKKSINRSEWTPTVLKNKNSNTSSILLQVPIWGYQPDNGTVIYETEFIKKELSGDIHNLGSRLESAVLQQLFVEGAIVDAHFSLNIYDFDQLHSGIRLVATELVAHSM